MNILKKICETQSKNLVIKKNKTKIDFFLSKKINRNQKMVFLNTLKTENKTHFNLIAEIKKRSPSAGEICKNFQPVNIAKIYKKAGAKCLSVLTEESFFGGKIDFINKIKNVVNIPILRKDFIIDEWQIYESYYNNADCILLILAILDDGKAKSFLKTASDLNLDVIVEVHNLDELKRALKLNLNCIGINNRDLKSLEISLNVFKELSKYIPKEIIKICESGLSRNDQLWDMKKYNADAFLIGEFLMKQSNILNATKSLIKK